MLLVSKLAAALVAVVAVGIVGQPAFASTTAEPTVVTHVVAGCGEPIAVHSPIPGHTLSAGDLHLPAAANSLFAIAAQRHVRWLTDITCTARPARHTLRLTTQAGPGFTASNWSGYQVNTASPNYAQATWTVPNVSATNDNASAFSDIWPGIGGGFNGGSGQLIQTGTEQNQICTDVAGECSYSYDYHFWIAIIPLMSSEEEITNFFPVPGDSVGTDVFWSAGTGAEFAVCDFTQSVCATGTQSSPAPSNTAEWIVERPFVLGSLPPFADTGNTTLSNCFFDETPQGSAADTIADGGAEPINAQGDTGNTLAFPLGLDSTGTSFGDIWQNYQ